MKYLAFILLLTIGCATPADIAGLKQSLRATDSKLAEHTDSLAALKNILSSSDESDFANATKEVISVENEPQAVQDGKESQHAQSQPDSTAAVRLFVTSSASCAPCVKLWKAVERGELAGFEVIKAGEFAGLQSYPAIRFEDTSSPTGWAVRYGWSVDQLTWLKRNLLPKKEIFRTASMSHREMKALHDSLHGGGSWSWPGDLATHLQRVHGVQTGGDPVQGSFFPYQRDSAIHGPRAVVRSVPQRKSFFGWSRNTAGKSCPSGRCP